MSNCKYLTTDTIKEHLHELRAGDAVYLSGTVYCARDAVHKKIDTLIREGKKLPFVIKDSIIYYCGPTPAKPGMAIGSCGPTTSSRMDGFMETLLDMGLIATIGKGGRSKQVNDAMKKHGAVYLCAMGGAGAISASCIKSVEVIAFEELGCESCKKMVFDKFPLVVGNDIYGSSLFD